MKTDNVKKQSGGELFFAGVDRLVTGRRDIHKDSTADIYRASGNWLRRLVNDCSLSLADVTPQLVDNYLRLLRMDGHLMENTVISYVSGFRSMYNQLKEEAGYEPRRHPFAHLRLRPEKTVKRALNGKVFEQVAALDLHDAPHLQQAVDICLFSYLGCGIPFVDLAHLTAANIKGDSLVYNRIKTGTAIRVDLTPGMQSILSRYTLPDNPYLFALLPSDGEISHEGYKRLLRNYNSDLKDIGDLLGLTEPFTSYVVRHTWATEALRNFIPVAVISQALGHTSEKTTRCYLDQLDQSELSKANERITGAVDQLLRRGA